MCNDSLLYVDEHNQSKTTSMATNKFATILQKNSHKIIVILVNAVLEWILILLLLLNSLLSYLIKKFANYYGLKPPCTLCSRLDHVFESRNHASFDLDSVCEGHGREISKLSYCCNHQRLGEFKNLCSDCSNSMPARNEEANEISPEVAFFTWIGDALTKSREENRCSCCDEISTKKLYPSSLLFKPSWDVIDYIQKKGCVVEVIDEDRNGEEASDSISQNKTESSAGQLNHETECEESSRDEHGDQGILKNENQMHSEVKFEANLDGTRYENMGILEAQDWESSQDFTNRSTNYLFQSRAGNEDDESLYVADMLLQNAEYVDSDKFICIELIDSDTIVPYDPLTNSSEKIEECEEKKGAMMVNESKDYSEVAALQKMKISEMDSTECFSTLTEENKTRDQEVEQYKQFIADIATVTCSDDSDNAEEDRFEVMDSFQDPKDKDCNLLSIEAKCMIAMGKEAMCFEQDNCAQSAATTILPHYLGIAKQVEDEHSPEEMMADGLEKRIMLEKRELGMEDFLNGSVFDEMEINSDSLTAEHLKTTIKAQSKALGELYAELEEERKAAAVAANETMAMITKLQEEKAAIQMEALQYQRMMEEQAEYDQEALQLLNDLMMKREKEKLELEKELEMYRHIDLDYESREKRITSRSTNGSDDYSIDNGCEREYGNGDSVMLRELSIKNINNDALKHLEEKALEGISDLTMPDISLAEFDEERLSILEELKNLETKLFALHNDEQQPSEDVKNSVDHQTKEFNQSSNIFSSEEKGALDTLSDDHVISKRLLPLFDATDQEFGEGEFDRNEISSHSVELEKSKLFIQDEFSHVYERLQALEADKEFLKHCVQSMMKGNKGIFLLQEILQHLRDLKSVELCASNFAEFPIADVSLHKEDEE